MKRLRPKPRSSEELVILSKGMPYDEEVQKTVVGCYFAKESMLDDPPPEEYFYPPGCPCQVIFQTMKEMRGQGRPVEYTLLLGRLTDKGLLDRAGGVGYVSDIFQHLVSEQHYQHFLRELRDKHLERTSIQGAVGIIEAAYSHDPDTLAEAASHACSSIAEAARGKKERGMEEELEEWSQQWDEMASGRRQSALPSRWEVWNAKGLGIQPGYHVILGPRGSGKSILLQNLLCDAAFTHQRPSMLFSFEMPVRMVLNRIIADMGNIHAGYLFSPDLTHPGKEVKQAILKCLEVIRKSKLQIIHDVSLSAEQIAGMARALKAKEGDCIVGLDYLQLLPDPKGRALDLREQMIAHNSSVFRNLSKALDIPVYALSQINKDGTSRESNAPEQDADTVVRVERYRLPDGSMKENGIEITKARNGPDGNLPLKLQGCHFRFTEDSTPNLP